MAVLARRRGNTWFLAGINGEDQPKNVAPNLAFLESGKYRFELIADGGDARSFGGKTMEVDSNSPVQIAVRPFGGFVATIRPAKD